MHVSYAHHALVDKAMHMHPRVEVCDIRNIYIHTHIHTQHMNTYIHTQTVAGKSPAPQHTPRQHSSERSGHNSTPSARSGNMAPTSHTGTSLSGAKGTRRESRAMGGDEERDRRSDEDDQEVYTLKMVRCVCVCACSMRMYVC